ncbi:unnamed protein product [Blepharisma stoltei]|uniref:RING-type domain-containing protein n=1 Tax=Blepharisma stoltei TaxID=1481888 RepID=A0AAU9J5B7_9CILI|nr:unnamed protein product [Blepharisma stoltei]
MQQTSETLLANSTIQFNTSCEICGKDYDPLSQLPYILQSCKHYFCLPCLNKNKMRSTAETTGSLFYVCPTCKGKSRYADKHSSLIKYLEKKVCIHHGLDFVAFCPTHDHLLCSTCLPEHKRQEYFMLDSPKIKKYTKDKEVLLTEFVNRMHDYVNESKIEVQELEDLRDQNSQYEVHISKIIEAKEEIIKRLNEKTQACIDEVEGIIKKKEIKELLQKVTDNLSHYAKAFKLMQKKKDKFPNLDVVSQLEIKNKDMMLVKPAKMFNRDRLVAPPIDSIEYEDSIQQGALAYKKRKLKMEEEPEEIREKITNELIQDQQSAMQIEVKEQEIVKSEMETKELEISKPEMETKELEISKPELEASNPKPEIEAN